MSFHCKVCGQNIGREGNEPVFGDGVCDVCEKPRDERELCPKCLSDGREVLSANCSFHREK